MNFNNFNFHQGDVQFFGIDAVPSEAQKVEKAFIAASERTGSRHALFGKYDQYAVDGGLVIDVKEECILNHSLKADLDAINNDLSEARVVPKKDHRHTVVPKGVYFVGIQNKLDPLSGHRKRVID